MVILAVVLTLLIAGWIALFTYKPDGCHVWQDRLGPVAEHDPNSYICVGWK
jgi:hypothetical protein